jgi:hypothetical protein
MEGCTQSGTCGDLLIEVKKRQILPAFLVAFLRLSTDH